MKRFKIETEIQNILKATNAVSLAHLQRMVAEAAQQSLRKAYAAGKRRGRRLSQAAESRRYFNAKHIRVKHEDI